MADDRPVPESPDPDGRIPEGRRVLGDAAPAPGTDNRGMTKVALALLVFLILICGWRLFEFWDSRQPPSGVQAQEATVLGYEALGRSRPGDGSAGVRLDPLPGRGRHGGLRALPAAAVRRGREGRHDHRLREER